MSVQSNEPDSQGQTSGNPAWQPLLEKLPEDLHSIILPELQQWDKQVQDKLQEARQPFDPYKPLVDNGIDVESINQALWLVDQLNEKPEDILKQLAETFEVNFGTSSDEDEDEEEDEEYDGVDITKHPQYKALAEQVEALQGEWQSEKQTKQQREEQAALEAQLDTLRNDNGEFDNLYVTALMSQGVKPEDAVKAYFDTINKGIEKAQQTTQQTDPPPVVMGGSGTTGSGLPDNPVRMGDLKNGQVEDMVIEMLKKQSEQ